MVYKEAKSNAMMKSYEPSLQIVSNPGQLLPEVDYATDRHG